MTESDSSIADALTDPAPPQKIGIEPSGLPLGQVLAERYEVRGRLGAGGMGAVYRVFDRELGEEVALKVLQPEHLGDPANLERFRREVRLARRITHPNVCRVFDLGEDAGAPFLTMELVDGRSLRALLANEPPVLERALDLLEQTARGVAATHEQGIVHRDLKPENVLVGAGGIAKIADFGLATGAARDATRNSLAGTPAYMSPEQLGGKELGPRSDVFSLGILSQEILTGRHPFGDGPPAVVTSAILRDPPRALEVAAPPEIAAALAAALGQALAKRPEDRFGSAAELADTLAAIRTKLAHSVGSRATLPGSKTAVNTPTGPGVNTPTHMGANRSVTTPTDAPPNDAPPAAAKPESKKGPRALALLLLGAAVLTAGLVLPGRDAPSVTVPTSVSPTPATGTAPASARPTSTNAPSEAQPTIEVSAFTDLVGEAGSEALARAATEGVRSGLRAVPGLAVVEAGGAPTWTARGSVQRIGAALRFEVQLGRGKQAGEPTDVEGPADAPGPLLDALRDRVVDEARLLVRDHRRRARMERETASAEARSRLGAYYDLVGYRPRPAQLEAGIRSVNDALAADPRFASARLARAELLLVRAGTTWLHDDVVAALADVDAVLSALPGDPEALTLRCNLVHFDLAFEDSPADGPVEAALDACAAALQADPSSGVTRVVLATLHDLRCENDRAIEALEQALPLDRSRTGPALAHLVMLALDTGRVELAERRSAELVAFQREERRLGVRSPASRMGFAPTQDADLTRGTVLLRLGRLDEARAAFERALADAGLGLGAQLSEVAALRGISQIAARRKAALTGDQARRLRELEAKLRAEAQREPSVARAVAGAYLWIDPAAALDWLGPLPPGASYRLAFLHALFEQAAGNDGAARRALAVSKPTTRWQKQCVDVVAARLRP